jgi:molybdate transport system substrate-binding protein
MTSVRTMVAGVLVTAVLLVGCGSDDEEGASDETAAATTVDSATSADPAPDALEGTITVMAPMPLNGVLTAAVEAFEADNPGATVEVSYGHVPALLAQLQEGVPGDLLLTPDEMTMGQAADADLLAGSPTPLGRNLLTLVVPAGNPGEVTGVESLADEDLTVVTCAAELPCGKLADQLASAAGVTIAVDSREPGGSPAIVTKAATGEIDLGVVFAVDVKAGGADVTALPVPDESAVSSQVNGAELAEAGTPDLAAAFLEFLASAEGRALFAAAGFAPV